MDLHMLYQALTVIMTLAFDEFSLLTWIIFSGLILVAFQLFDKLTSSSTIWHGLFKFDYIKPEKMLEDKDLTFIHYLYTGINRCVTTPIYLCHTVAWLRQKSAAGAIDWGMGIGSLTMGLIEIILYFAFYDLVYWVFHRTLHQPWIYGYIHKHHHHQISPHRGTYDGINTHILEFVFGEYLHLWSIMVVMLVTPGPIQGAPIVLFYILTSFMASLNHTRWAVHVPFFFDVRDHDVHHRLSQANYGQFVMWWDHLFGTYRDYFNEKKRRDQERDVAAKLRAKESEQKQRTQAHGLPKGPVPQKAVITGGNGMLGKRLTQLLLERGCREVVCIDINPPPLKEQARETRVGWINMDISDEQQVLDPAHEEKLRGCEVLFHSAALVGPYFRHELYYKVNYIGSLNMIRLCKQYGIEGLVDVSSPSTRFTGLDIEGCDEADFEATALTGKTHEYARTKLLAEQEIKAANGSELLNGHTLQTCVIAPHQIYGAEDRLFLPSFLANAHRVRIFGHGNYQVSFTHVDNVCHALILASQSLLSVEKVAAGQFYFVTDDNAYNFWDRIDQACQLYLKAKGLPIRSLRKKVFVPVWVLYAVAWVGVAYTRLTGHTVKLTPFAVNMTTIHRYFCIGKLKRELGYQPVKAFEEGWEEVVDAVVRRCASE